MFIFLLFQLIAVSLGRTACEGETFCITGTSGSASESLNQTMITMTVLSSGKGWAAIGFGREMTNAIIVTGWLNSSSGYTVTTMTTGMTKKIPDLSSIQIATPVELARDKPSWARLAFSFTIRQENPLHSIKMDDNYIWV